MKQKEANLARLIGKRLLAEANDLKRTLPTIANDLGLEENDLSMIVNGEVSLSRALDVIHLFANRYPVKISDILLDSDDTKNAIVLMKASESVCSSRIYRRKDKKNQMTPYYDYRDTATSKFSPFKPEWIKELRVVENADPENPDVAYNHGHFLHQMTAIIGPVNFYWEVRGKKYCQEMNTGDSNFISPFWKHSFTARSSDQDAIIIAVTFSGSVGRARSELYALGEESIAAFSFDNKDRNRAITQLVKQIMANHILSPSSLQSRLLVSNIDINIIELLDEKCAKDEAALRRLARFFQLPQNIFDFPSDASGSEVVTKSFKSKDAYVFTEEYSDYQISRLAEHSEMPEVMGFNMRVLSNNFDKSGVLRTSLHSFLYNYSKNTILLSWEFKGQWLTEAIEQGDSLYMQPNISHKLCVRNPTEGTLFLFRAPGYIDINLQKELSSFSNTNRVMETSAWFD